ncbi:glycoside hydrolase family 2 TIM barrel-domain containing protein [Neobacillus niacini]|uniref:glycoside hydrolase family 2 TIM barrel-domain containing protein n=1 Tax=Neobacillus niacini TaxID=86668 RepID=UPI0039831248
MTIKSNSLFSSYENAMNNNSLNPTFELREVNSQRIPFQNGIPYPSFEPQDRLIFSLEGKWKKKRFKADHDWTMLKRDKKWIQSTQLDFNGVARADYDDSSWGSHNIPLPENNLTGKEQTHAAETYEDGVWYRKKVFLETEWENKVVTLKCLGLSYIGDFWINGQYVGYHEGGYTPFAFDVTEYLRVGDNTFAIRVDNPPWKTRYDTIPAVDNDFFNYTGIIQDIYLEGTTGFQVVRADVVPENINGKVKISVVIENRTSQAQHVFLKNQLFETDFLSNKWLEQPEAKSICANKAACHGLYEINLDLLPNETRVVKFNVHVYNPKLWSIRKPHLYVLGVSLETKGKLIDTFFTQFGIRTISTKKAQILLNEVPVFLAGVARHEEWPEFGRTASWDRIKIDFQLINNLHVNMVRTAHYPNHIYTFILLDRLGLTAMSEIPLWQFETKHYEIQEKRKISYQMWREMIFSNYNRPSIMMWSTQNESKDVKLRKKYNETLVNEVRNNYNDHRLITQSAAADQPGFEDESIEPLDVAGWTMYFGIFHGSTPYEGTRNFIEKAHQKWPDKPILNTEYGIWSNADGSNLEKQVDIYQKVQLALLEKATVSPEGLMNVHGYVAGMDYWTAFDWYVNHNQFYQTMGLCHMDRKTKKPLFYEFVKDHKRLMEKTNGMATKFPITMEARE